jgi:hypothetical protein
MPAPMIDILDARARRWPTPLRWLYAGMKWSLVALGFWVMIVTTHERVASVWSLLR